MTGAVVSVQFPGPESGKLEKYHRAVSKGRTPQAIRAALEKILEDAQGEGNGRTLVSMTPQAKKRWANAARKEAAGEPLA